MSQPFPQPSSSMTSSTLDKLALVWAALATLIPVVFGVILVRNPGSLLAPGITVLDVMRGMGLRNFAFSLVLAVALLTQPRRVAAFLLAARGLTEWADALSGVFEAPVLVPVIGGLGDLLFAYVLYKSQRER
jgi:hypothetical protein